MTGVPTSIHLGPFLFHLYGLGLAVAAYVAFVYGERRLVRAGLDVRRFPRFTALLIVVGLIGARLANIATNWSYYQGRPGRWIALWQGGLASFGGIALALPAALWALHRWWPRLRWTEFTDALIPAIVAGWALGRVLGPQFMIGGGGHIAHQWFGMHYAGQIGKRVPVPLIQGLEDGLLWGLLLTVQRQWRARFVGALTALAMVIWGMVRAADEHWLLGENSKSGSVGVQLAALALSVGGGVLWVVQQRRTRRRI